jgi:hypothetical protein
MDTLALLPCSRAWQPWQAVWPSSQAQRCHGILMAPLYAYRTVKSTTPLSPGTVPPPAGGAILAVPCLLPGVEWGAA